MPISPARPQTVLLQDGSDILEIRLDLGRKGGAVHLVGQVGLHVGAAHQPEIGGAFTQAGAVIKMRPSFRYFWVSTASGFSLTTFTSSKGRVEPRLVTMNSLPSSLSASHLASSTPAACCSGVFWYTSTQYALGQEPRILLLRGSVSSLVRGRGIMPSSSRSAKV